MWDCPYSRLISTNSMCQNLDSRIFGCVYGRLAELSANAVRAGGCLISREHSVCEIPALLGDILRESCSVQMT